MTDFQIKRLPYNLTAQAGLSLVGQYLKRFAQIDQIIDPRFPISGQGGIATSSLLKAYVGLLCTGKSDFDAIESLRRGLRIQSLDNELMELFGARSVHPVGVRIGGFHGAPSLARVRDIREKTARRSAGGRSPDPLGGGHCDAAGRPGFRLGCDATPSSAA
ncbi:hypothetical protein [Thiobacillus denitrificans]|uniref:hypothetical protein n=1 Tax=Thiobacillus denitrificans TaxID=36861 RepID=UPI000753CD53|nr:hypothetical protein [Thiobacillus denitrificans]